MRAKAGCHLTVKAGMSADLDSRRDVIQNTMLLTILILPIYVQTVTHLAYYSVSAVHALHHERLIVYPTNLLQRDKRLRQLSLSFLQDVYYQG